MNRQILNIIDTREFFRDRDGPDRQKDRGKDSGEDRGRDIRDFQSSRDSDRDTRELCDFVSKHDAESNHVNVAKLSSKS